jgi:regulator of protease activity HflC (stomatin/prohibitin superfamily)
MEFALTILVVIAIIVGMRGIKAVPQGMEYTVERFGQYRRNLKPSLNMINPVLERIGAKISMMETVLDVPSQEFTTQDNVLVKFDGVVFYKVFDSAKAAYEVQNLKFAIMNLIIINLRTVIASMYLDEFQFKQDEINTRLLSILDEATIPWGTKVLRLEIRNLTVIKTKQPYQLTEKSVTRYGDE